MIIQSRTGASVDKVFISHAAKDKPVIMPVLAGLIRSGVPFYIDQKDEFVWPEDIKALVEQDDRWVEAIGSGDFRPRLEEAIRTCPLFVVLYTEHARDASGIWDELVEYRRRQKTENAPAPIIVQASRLSFVKTIDISNFLHKDATSLNIQGLEPSRFDSNDAHDRIVRIIRDHYFARIAETVLERARALQGQSAARHADGVVRVEVSTGPYTRVPLIYIPHEDISEPGEFVTEAPLSPLGTKSHSPLTLAEAAALREALPVRLDLIDLPLLQRMYTKYVPASLTSPFGLAARNADDAFWVTDGSGIRMVGVDLMPRTSDRAFFYAFR